MLQMGQMHKIHRDQPSAERDLSEYLRYRETLGYHLQGGLLRKALTLARKYGIAHLVTRALTYPNAPWVRFGWYPLTAAYRWMHHLDCVMINGRKMRMGHFSSAGERIVEIPLALDFLKRRMGRGKRCLEIGNVLAHHFPFPHDVVDKYEVHEGVTNVDVLRFQPSQPYDLIISVSTLEHIGFDEADFDLNKTERTLRHLYENCLGPGGWMFLTMPLGYHPEVDGFSLDGRLGFIPVHIFERTSVFRTWSEVRPSREWLPPLYSYSRHVTHAFSVWEVQKPLGNPSLIPASELVQATLT